jgi:hypothetical protein
MSPWHFFAEHSSEILAATLDHVTLVLIAMAIAIAIAVPLGMFIVQRRTLSSIALGITSVFQTIPSLALFGFLIPIPFIGGIGRRTAIVALVLYALLPILRNTYVGLTGVDRSILEAFSPGLKRNPRRHPHSDSHNHRRSHNRCRHRRRRPRYLHLPRRSHGQRRRNPCGCHSRSPPCHSSRHPTGPNRTPPESCLKPGCSHPLGPRSCGNLWKSQKSLGLRAMVRHEIICRPEGMNTGTDIALKGAERKRRI